METVWFIFLAFVITMYVVLDGFDLGAAALYLALARNEEERREIINAIGPVWSGNEVWLVVAGGTMFLAFPHAYAGAFSGLYFGLILVLWLLIGRGLALELRHQIDNTLWHSACDVIFCGASAALALVLGVALGNVVRGVPLNAAGYFSLPLFNILNWYGLLTGIFSLTVVCTHGANFIAFRSAGEVGVRALRWATRLWWVQTVLFVAMIAPTYAVRHSMISHLFTDPWRLVFPAIAIAGLTAQVLYLHKRRALHAFLASCAFIVGLLTTMAAGLYPNILPARQGHPHGLTVHNAAAGHHALEIGLIWWPVGITLGCAYLVLAYRLFYATKAKPFSGFYY
jgi:cytochrome d ubiquinol oxidase subunit II